MPDMLSYALYDAFTECQFGGSQAAIILDAGGIGAPLRSTIARELGYPATAFVSAVEGAEISVRFHSTVAELPMCGHGTMGLVTRLIDAGKLSWDGRPSMDLTLHLPNGSAKVRVNRREDGRVEVMLQVRPPVFRDDGVDPARLCAVLGLTPDALSSELPVETAAGDFIHLVVPVRGLPDMKAIRPDFDAIVKLCHVHGLETIAVICSQTERRDSTVHVRDFCPAVGVAESAAAGTTNAAVAAYLLRNGQIQTGADGRVQVLAEQGIELGRPSSVRSELLVRDGKIASQYVGGVATCVIEGKLNVPVTEGRSC